MDDLTEFEIERWRRRARANTARGRVMLQVGEEAAVDRMMAEDLKTFRATRWYRQTLDRIGRLSAELREKEGNPCDEPTS